MHIETSSENECEIYLDLCDVESACRMFAAVCLPEFQKGWIINLTDGAQAVLKATKKSEIVLFQTQPQSGADDDDELSEEDYIGRANDMLD